MVNNNHSLHVNWIYLLSLDYERFPLSSHNSIKGLSALPSVLFMQPISWKKSDMDSKVTHEETMKSHLLLTT